MAILATELAYLGGTVLTGAYIVLSLAESILRVAASRGLPLSVVDLPRLHLNLIVAVVLIPFHIFFNRQWHFYHGTRVHGCKLAPVFPHTDPILGSDLFRIMLRAVKEHNVLDVINYNFANYGKTHWENATGSWWVMTSEPENVKAVLATSFDSFPILSLRQKAIRLILGSRSIFASNGADWHFGRSMMRPVFVRNQVADLECMERHTKNFLARLPADGSPFDVQELLLSFTMDAATDFMFGLSTNMLIAPEQESVEYSEAFEYAAFQTVTRSRLGWIAFLFPDKKFDQAVKTCSRYISGRVTASLANAGLKERPYVFLDEMVKSGASHDLVCALLSSMILGGRDTSANALTTFFRVLGSRPDVVDKIRAEVVCLEGRQPTYEEVRGLKYLNNSLKEVLRLWPPVPTNTRTASKDIALPRGGGPDGRDPIFVPKGTDVRFSVQAIHRNKEYYGPDADEFRPERWEEGLRPSWDYLPFSGGPRVCIGQQFALTQMAYLMTRFFQHFDQVVAQSDEPMKYRLLVAMKMVGECSVSVRPVDGFEAEK